MYQTKKIERHKMGWRNLKLVYKGKFCVKIFFSDAGVQIKVRSMCKYEKSGRGLDTERDRNGQRESRCIYTV